MKNVNLVVYQLIFWTLVITILLSYDDKNIIKELLDIKKPQRIFDYSFIFAMISLFFIGSNLLIYKSFEEFKQGELFTNYSKKRKIIDSSISSYFFEIFSILKKGEFGIYKSKFLLLKENKMKEKYELLQLFIPIILYLINFINTLNLIKGFENENISYFYYVIYIFMWFPWLIIYIRLFFKESRNSTCFIKNNKVFSMILTLIFCLYYFVYLNDLELKDLNFPYTILLINTVFILQPFVFHLVYLVRHPILFLNQEYEVAKIRKMQIENKLILKACIDEFSNQNKSLNICYSGLKDSVYKLRVSLKNEKYLYNFLTTYCYEIDGFKNKLKLKQVDNIVNKVILPLDEMKDARAQYIKSRNQDNLLTSLITFLILCGLLLFLNHYGSFNNKEILIKNFKNIVFVLISIRFMARSVEICRAFFLDIQDGFNNKKSSLSKNERALLSIKSLLEITIYSSILILILHANKLDIFTDLAVVNTFLDLEKILNLVLYSFSVSIFDASFENFSDIIKRSTGTVTLVRIIHLFQVVTSLVLLTICLGTYLNISTEKNKLRVIKKGNTLILEEFLIDKFIPVVSIENCITINCLNEEIKQLYEENKISLERYEQYESTVNSYKFI